MLAVLLAVVVLAVFYARCVEPDMLVVKEITVETDKDVGECKIVFFSDTHFGCLYDQKHVEEIVDTINGRKADIVVFGGDLLDDYSRDREILDLDYLRRQLGRIEAGEAKYAVFGNHDYGGGATRVYRKLMEESGFRLLVDETDVLEKYNIEVIGFDDYLFGATDSAFYHIPNDRFHLVIMHEPVVSKRMEAKGDNFALSGHTHGGQVSVPYLTEALLPKGADRFVKGLYQDPVRMYVSSGIGLTRYPFRLFNVPEIIEIRVVKRK